MKQQELTAEQPRWIKYLALAFVMFFIGRSIAKTEVVEIEAECEPAEIVEQVPKANETDLYRSFYIEGCGDTEYCHCTFDYLASSIPLAELSELTDENPEFMNAVVQCMHLYE